MAMLGREYGRRPKTFEADAVIALQRYAWPGNVRELRNIIERLVIMTPGDRIEAAHLPAPLLSGASASRPAPAPDAAAAIPDEFPSLAAARDDFEKRYIRKKHQECGGNMSRTAEALRVERSNLYRKMKAYGLIPQRRGEGA